MQKLNQTFKINPLYEADGYKVAHHKMLAPGTTKLYGTWIPRSLKYMPGGIDKIMSAGQQLVVRYLHSTFQEHFFDKDSNVAIQFANDMSAYLGMDYDGSHFLDLYELGYLPIRVKSLPEGIFTQPNIPHMTFVNTVDGYAWLTLFLETYISKLAWQMPTVATIGHKFKENAKAWVNYTDKENLWLADFMCHDFHSRGGNPFTSIACGLGFSLSNKGSDTLNIIPASRYYYDEAEDSMSIFSVNACFPEGAEILTDKGFMDFKDLSYSDKVAQYNQDGTIEFVEPIKLHSYHFNGNLLSFIGGAEKQINFCVTDNHRIPYISGKGNFVIKEAKDLPLKPIFKISGLSKIENRGLNDFERLLIAFQADGSYSTRDNEYTGFRKGTLPMRFVTLKKERKIKRLEELLDRLKFNYTKSTYDKGNSYRIEVPFTKDLSKTFDWVDLTKISSQWCNEFIEELQYWDGSKAKKEIIVYSSIIKDNVDIIQAIASLGGIKTHYREYDDPRGNRDTIHHLTITLNRFDFNLKQPLRKIEIPYNGKVRCVTVPSGMFVARQNNRVIISGNSEHSVSTTKIFTVGEQQMIADWLKLFPKGILSIVSDTFDLFKLITEYLPANKEAIMARDGKLVIRPDSGDPVDIICGTYRGSSYVKLENRDSWTPEEKGVIELLWDIFGGTVNEQGYKVLDPHIGAIYGDSLNLERQIKIYERLEAKGFAASNIVLGVGSYTMVMLTRDSAGYAAKGSWFEVENLDDSNCTNFITESCQQVCVGCGCKKSYNIYKDPVTDGGSKKSLKGLMQVKLVGNEYVVNQECTWEQEEDSELKTIYENGVFKNQTTLTEIRNKLN